MEGYIEEYSQDYWADLPVEIACEIITRIDDLRSLFNHMQASKTFYELAQVCIRELNSKVRMEVPLRSLVKFQNLESLGDNIILTVTPDEVNLLSSLPRLRRANILFSNLVYGAFNQLSSEITVIFQELGLSRKIPLVNFRIHLILSTIPTTILIQGDRFGILSFEDVSPLIQKLYPELKYVQLPSGYSSGETLISRDLRDFLREGDFGLTDPSHPPSGTNPPLRDYLEQFADFKMMPKVLGDIIEIYAIYHHLIHEDEITLDETMKRYIQPTIIWENKVRKSRFLGNAYTRYSELYKPLSLDKISIYSIPDMILQSTHPERWNFEQFDIPVSTLLDAKLINKVIRHYELDSPFYTTNGTIQYTR